MRKFTAALLILIAVAFAAPACAQDGPKAAKAAMQASKDFETYLAKTLAARQAPDLRAAPAGPLFTRIFDVKTLRALPPTGGQDLPWLADWLGAVSTSYTALINFGADPKSENYMQAVLANIERNEDEVALASEFMMRLFARVSNSATAYSQSLTEAERNTPARQKSLAGVRSGYAKSFGGTIQFSADDIKPANAQITSLALRDTAQDYLAAASSEQRAEILELLKRAEATTKDAQTRGNFAAIIQAFDAAK